MIYTKDGDDGDDGDVGDDDDDDDLLGFITLFWLSESTLHTVLGHSPGCSHIPFFEWVHFSGLIILHVVIV